MKTHFMRRVRKRNVEYLRNVLLVKKMRDGTERGSSKNKGVQCRGKRPTGTVCARKKGSVRKLPVSVMSETQYVKLSSGSGFSLYGSCGSPLVKVPTMQLVLTLKVKRNGIIGYLFCKVSLANYELTV
ncbi:hypothetical protein SESBI_13717 [Sesbania bispinosa]|nr:hypothetical protein SESBI_13717 [Sesbania bispinosa]